MRGDSDSWGGNSDELLSAPTSSALPSKVESLAVSQPGPATCAPVELDWLAPPQQPGEIALGLSAAHAQDMIHRDIKPANIWLEGEAGRVKILDFGLARVGGEVQLTRTGIVVGTPAYMSPEQAAGKDIDARSDLFSLGAVLYRLGTGELPFKAADPLGLLIAIGNDTPVPPWEINPAL